eukprot:scaffold44194_cov175-Skeletonema_marinoi.AAC.2
MPAFLRNKEAVRAFFLTTAFGAWGGRPQAWLGCRIPTDHRRRRSLRTRWSILRAKCKMQMNLGHRQPQK